MPLVIPPGYAQCSVEITNSGDPQPWYVTHGIDVSDVGGDFIAAGKNVLQAFDVAWSTWLRPSSRITGVYLTIGSDGGNYTLYVTPPTAMVGSSTAEKLPQNCAYLVQKVTTRPGRAGKGRCFLPGIAPEQSVDDVGVLTSGAILSAQDACDLWLVTLANATGAVKTPMVLLHNAGIPGGSTPTPVTALRIDSRIATQRRRLRR